MIEKLDRHIRVEDGVRISCPPTQADCMDKINELIDTVNEIKQYLDWDEISRKPSEEDLCDMVKDPKYWKEQDPETVRKVELAFQKKYGEITQNSTNNVKNSHLFQGNEQKAPITLTDVFNEMGKLYADLWNKLEDIHSEIKATEEKEHFADTSKKIKSAADSANKNLDDALGVAIDALTNAREEIGKMKNDECPCGKPHIWFEIDNALQTIARILKITKGGKDE